jgi:acyl carrier protein
VSADRLRGTPADSLFRLDWVPLQPADDAAEYVEMRFPPVAFSVQAAHAAAGKALAALQSWDGESPLVFVTQGAVSDDVTDLVHAPLWGLVRSAQSENPGRFVLVDVDDIDAAASAELVAKAVATGEPQLLIRNGVVHGGRLVRAAPGDALVPPAGAPAWRLGTAGRGTPALLPCPEVLAPLSSGQIRIDVRAAGVDLRDARIGLGTDSGPGASPGRTAAGVVTEVGAGVTGLAVGDRVMGLFAGAIGPVAVTDRESVAAIPREWSYATAASVSAAHLTTGPDRVQEVLAGLLARFERGEPHLPPVRAWDVRRAPKVFRLLGQGEHPGRYVLTMPRTLDPYGTVLVTGATGTLGALVAKHLVRRHGVHDLVLLSRRGPDAPGAAELLAALDGRARIVACDAADRAALAEVIARIPNLTGVVHAAGVLDDGLIGSLTPQHLERVMAPKLDAAWNLHELTKDLDLAEFTVFSSASATLGSAGQGNYAAANTFLDALAQRRTALGLSGRSLAWGLWAERSELTAEADFDRMRRSGVTGLSEQDGLALFDAGRAGADTVLVPIRLDVTTAARGDGEVPALLRALVRAPARRAAGAADGSADALKRRLAGLPLPERAAALTDVVRTHVATVLGHTGPAAVDPERAFTELGFDSLASVELRNRLAAATGLRLRSTLAFDHPTPAELAEHLGGELAAHDGPR